MSTTNILRVLYTCQNAISHINLSPLAFSKVFKRIPTHKQSAVKSQNNIQFILAVICDPFALLSHMLHVFQ